MNPGTLALTALVGAVASGLNAVAGGGSLISFPFLTVCLHVDSLQANATNTVSLWPGSLAGGVGFGSHLKSTFHHLVQLALPTALGALAGAWALLHTGKALFDLLVPALIALAVVALWFQPAVRRFALKHHAKPRPLVGLGLQFLVALYGGYFGAGMGMMMLGAFALTMDADIHAMNAVKNWLGTIINLVAAIYFLGSGVVQVPIALTLILGSVVGGFVGAKLSQKVDSEKLRVAICIYGACMAAFYAYRAFAK